MSSAVGYLVLDCEVPAPNEAPAIAPINKVPFLLGRGGSSDLVLCLQNAQGKQVISRAHCEIRSAVSGVGVRHAICRVFDLKSLNGTFVNGVRVDTAILMEGDVLQLGGAANTPMGSALKIYKSDVNIRYRFTTINPLVDKVQATRGSPPVAPSSSLSEKRSKMQSKLLSEGGSFIAPLLKSSSTLTPARNRPTSSGSKRKLPQDDIEGIEMDTINNDCAKSIPAIRAHSSANAVLDIGTLRKSVTCLLCDKLFCDAVVARCSHAFCRACMEKHLRAAASSCPVCNSPPLRAFKAIAKKKKVVFKVPPLFYHRSEVCATVETRVVRSLCIICSSYNLLYRLKAS